jgi:DNA-binding XRE family transcriptional regulator
MNKLKELRQQKGLTQYELARLIGRYQSKVWLWEKGYYRPKEREKREIARVLGVDVDEIFPENAPKTI